MYKKQRFVTKIYLLPILLISFLSCKKYITVDAPSTSIGTKVAFQTNTSAAQVFSALYAEIASSIDNGTLVSTCILPELSADNLALYDEANTPRYIDYYKNSLESNYFNAGQFDTYWMRLYKQLYTVNTAIEELTGNQFLSENVATRLLGEAYFMRAFIYFYLVNFYKEVPLVLSTDYQQTAVLKKNTSSEVYAQILNDLVKAEERLDYTYTAADVTQVTDNRLRPNLAAVKSLQARVYLYEKKYDEAETAATAVIDRPAYVLTSPENVFLKNSSETIWGLQPVEVGLNTRLALLYLIPVEGPNFWDYPVYISESLLASFEAGDARKEQWLGSVAFEGKDFYYPRKYKRGRIPDSKNIEEYTIVFRLSELLLIRAEARNEQGNTIDAVADINLIRSRSRSNEGSLTDPLPAISNALDQKALRPIILHERRVELFTEWGHRWFDLRRSGTLDAVMSAMQTEKGGPEWEPYKAFHPIPQSELNTNAALTQTAGYSN